MQLPTLVATAAAVSAPAGFRLAPVVEISVLDRAFAIESASYPEDEAATREKLQMRILEASDYFYGAFQDDGGGSGPPELHGFVCGTLTTSDTLTEEAMSAHEPEGTTLCIHSVVIEESLRRRGIATWMLSSYLASVAANTPAERVLLLCKSHLVGFYEACGFANLGVSPVVHGQDPWYGMGLMIRR